MTTLYDKIQDAWRKANGNDVTQPPHLMSAEEEARQLEAQLSKRLEPAVASWKEGLISSTEFVDKVLSAAFTQ